MEEESVQVSSGQYRLALKLLRELIRSTENKQKEVGHRSYSPGELKHEVKNKQQNKHRAPKDYRIVMECLM